MRPSTRSKKFILLLAVLALLTGAFFRVVGQAQGRSVGDLIEVCTTLGARWIASGEAPAANDAAPKAPSDAGRGHCPYCSVHVTDLGLPPANGAVLAVAVQRQGLPSIFYLARRTPFAWIAGQPRAPPFSV